MRRSSASLAMVWLFLFACDRDEPSTKTAAAPAPSSTPEPRAPSSAPSPAREPAAAPPAAALKSNSRSDVAAWTEDLSGALVISPAQGPGGALPYEVSDPGDPEPEFPTSATWKFGWSSDSASFAYCDEDASDEGGTCYLVGVDQKIRERVGATKWAKIADAHGPFARGQTQWRHSDIELTWKRSGPKLVLGGRVVQKTKAVGEGKAKVLAWTFDEGTYFDDEGDVGPGVISISPDGEHMAVIAVAQLGYVDDQRLLTIEATDAFAAEIYGAHGFEALRSKRYDDAETWFLRAGGVSAQWKHPYNLACARALGRADGVEVALAEAIARGGAQVKARAKAEADLASVRELPWFTALVRD